MALDKLPTRLLKEPLVDAVFEVRFSSSVAASDVITGLLFTKLQGHDKKIERLPLAEFPSHLRNGDPQLRYQPFLRMFWDRFLVLIGDRVIALACQLPYPGWGAFKPKILETVGVLVDSGIVEKIERYSMKYVDIIDGADIEEQIRRVNLQLSIGTHALKHEPFNVSIELSRDNFTHLVRIAAPATAKTVTSETRQGVLIEVDSLKNSGDGDASKFQRELPELIESLHTSNKRAFFDCLKKETIEYLEPQYD